MNGPEYSEVVWTHGEDASWKTHQNIQSEWRWMGPWGGVDPIEGGKRTCLAEGFESSGVKGELGIRINGK